MAQRVWATFNVGLTATEAGDEILTTGTLVRRLVMNAEMHQAFVYQTLDGNPPLVELEVTMEMGGVGKEIAGGMPRRLVLSEGEVLMEKMHLLHWT